jgi:tetratricopeptide (TPR) repeat protein
MTPHHSRAELLLAQSRPVDAEKEAGLALAQDPGDPLALTLLARARVDQNREAEALEPADAAVAAAPDWAFVHHVRAHVLLRLGRPKDALAAVEQALRLAPDADEFHAQRAAVRLALRDWAGALADTEAALRLNAANVFAQNLRATALTRLGRTDEADAVGARTLEQAPDDAYSHATQGWTQLHRGDARRAQEHFREALRLRPDFESAREGMLEALKARNPLYRGMLAYFLWMGRQSGRVQWAFVIVTFFGQRVVRGLAESQPAAGALLWPLLILFYAFVYLTWTAVPMFNLLLRLDRHGRYVLSRRERAATNWFGASVAVIALAAAWWAAAPHFASRQALIVAAMLSVCVAATVSRPGPRGRKILGWATVALAALAFGAFGLAFAGGAGAGELLTLFFVGFLAFQFASNLIRD